MNREDILFALGDIDECYILNADLDFVLEEQETEDEIDKEIKQWVYNSTATKRNLVAVFVVYGSKCEY